MPIRLPLLALLLLLSTLLLAAGGAHGSPAGPALEALAFEEPLEETEDEGEELEADCALAEEEAGEGELSVEEAGEICEEVAGEAAGDVRAATHPPAKHPRHGKAKHRAHRHKKACRQKAAGGKRRCPQRSRRH